VAFSPRTGYVQRDEARSFVAEKQEDGRWQQRTPAMAAVPAPHVQSVDRATVRLPTSLFAVRLPTPLPAAFRRATMITAPPAAVAFEKLDLVLRRPVRSAVALG
jgi:hypothetical protein